MDKRSIQGVLATAVLTIGVFGLLPGASFFGWGPDLVEIDVSPPPEFLAAWRPLDEPDGVPADDAQTGDDADEAEVDGDGVADEPGRDRGHSDDRFESLPRGVAPSGAPIIDPIDGLLAQAAEALVAGTETGPELVPGGVRSGGPRAGKGRRGRRGKRRCPDSFADIHKESTDSWVIGASLRNYYTENLKRFVNLGWSGPYRGDDGTKGWKISGFSCRSPVWHAGFRRGDVILTVNGRKTRTWPQVVMMYTRLRSAEAFEVELVRRGRPMVLRYRIAPSA